MSRTLKRTTVNGLTVSTVAPIPAAGVRFYETAIFSPLSGETVGPVVRSATDSAALVAHAEAVARADAEPFAVRVGGLSLVLVRS